MPAAIPDAAPVRAFLEARHVALAREVAEFAARELAPLPRAHDDGAARTQAREILALLGRSGWLRRALAEDSPEADLRTCALVREALAAASPLADAVFALQALGSMPIRIAGDAAMRARWLPGVVEGRLMAAFAMTEPEAGSDVSALETVARRDGADWVLDGRKWLISNAGIADFYTVFAATDPARGNRGIGCFVVAAGTPGLRFERAQVLSEPHPLGEIALEGCRIPGSALLGGAEDGFRIGMATLDRLRATVAAAACGMAARALEEAAAHALRRVQFGKPLAEQPIVRQKLARMATDLTAARLLTYRAAWEKDRGAERVTLESAMAKTFATEAAQRIVDDAVQVLGGIGVLADHPVERLYLAIRPLRIYEGATDVLEQVIAGHVLKARTGP